MLLRQLSFSFSEKFKAFYYQLNIALLNGLILIMIWRLTESIELIALVGVFILCFIPFVAYLITKKLQNEFGKEK